MASTIIWSVASLTWWAVSTAIVVPIATSAGRAFAYGFYTERHKILNKQQQQQQQEQLIHTDLTTNTKIFHAEPVHL